MGFEVFATSLEDLSTIRVKKQVIASLELTHPIHRRL
jgi:hypothetical protein